MDLDPLRVRTALAAGDAVIYGDAADEGVLKSAGIERANAVVVTFSDTSRSLAIVRAVRRLRTELPILVRAIGRHAPRGTARGRGDGSRAGDARGRADAGLQHAAHAAGAALARDPHGRRDPPPALPDAALGDRPRSARARPTSPGRSARNCTPSCCRPAPGRSAGRSSEIRGRGAEVSFTAVRRDGIVGPRPGPAR